MGHASIRTPAAKVGTAGRARVIALGLMAMAGSAPGKAGGAPAAPAAAVAATPHCTSGEQSAITEIACELAWSLRSLEASLGAGVVVAAAVPTADRAVSRGPELSARVATAIAHALGSGARASSGASTLARARAEARGASLLVFVAVEIAGGEVRAVADAHLALRSSAPRGFWDRVRGLRDEPGAHASASRRLDGEIASFLPPVPLVAAHVDKAGSPTPDVVALACGDVDGDSALEIALVGRRKIQLGRVRQARFVVHAEAAWPALAPIAPAPLREPIAQAEIVAGRFLTVGSTDRENGVLLSGTLARLRRLEASVPWGHGSCLVRSGTALGLPGPCERGGKTSLDVGDVRTDAVASGLVVNAAGTARAVVAWRAPSDGAVTLRDDAGRTAHVASTGGALALADLDRDGVPELLASENTFNPAEDALVVRSWSEDGEVRERLRLPVPDGIRAIAACPAEDARMAPIVVATGTALWIIR
jgi:hypothetical protein